MLLELSTARINKAKSSTLEMWSYTATQRRSPLCYAFEVTSGEQSMGDSWGRVAMGMMREGGINW